MPGTPQESDFCFCGFPYQRLSIGWERATWDLLCLTSLPWHHVFKDCPHCIIAFVWLSNPTVCPDYMYQLMDSLLG